MDAPTRMDTSYLRLLHRLAFELLGKTGRVPVPTLQELGHDMFAARMLLILLCTARLWLGTQPNRRSYIRRLQNRCILSTKPLSLDSFRFQNAVWNAGTLPEWFEPKIYPTSVKKRDFVNVCFLTHCIDGIWLQLIWHASPKNFVTIEGRCYMRSNIRRCLCGYSDVYKSVFENRNHFYSVSPQMRDCYN